MTTYPLPSEYPLPSDTVPAGVLVELAPSATGMPRDTEYVRFFIGPVFYGLVVLPTSAAHDLVHRMADTPSPLSEMTPETVGHVRWWIDRDYREGAGPDEEPPAWTCELIELIRTGGEEDRRRIGAGFRAYTAAVTIATTPGGLDHLRGIHDSLLANARTAAGE